MLNFIKSLFKKEEDPNRAIITKLFDNNWREFDDIEQAVIMLRLSGMSQKDTAYTLEISQTKVEKVEERIIKRLKK